MRKTILLGIIVVIAFLFRFWQVGSIPPSLTWDEVAWGYNAYSLGVDGKDEFGKFLPTNYLESFGDFKPPVYAYVDILPVKLLGLHEVATRLPSVVLGTLTVLISFFLVKRIFATSKQKELYAYASALILALSPWHIMLSRAAFEANIATFFIACGVWLFLGGVQEKRWYLVPSLVSFGLAIYTFNSARVVAPLLVIMLCIGFYRQLLLRKQQVIIAGIIAIVMVMPLVPFLLSPQAGLRFKEVNIFSDVSLVKQSNQEIQNDGNSAFSRIIHNRRLLYTAAFLHHYFDNLTPSFLFIKGDGNPKFSTQDVGELYLWDLPFFVIGIFLLFKKKEGSWWIIPLWLLLAIIPAATARETPHALRTEGSLPTFQIFVAYGLAQVLLFAKKRQKFVGIVAGVLLLVNVGYFLHGYYAHYSREFSGEWQYGYRDALFYAAKQESNYEKIAITNELGRPYMYYLFYNKITPQIFRSDSKITRDTFGFVHVERVGKYYFYDKMPTEKDTVLYIAVPGEVPSNAKILTSFPLLNGQNALVAYTL